MPAPIFDEGVPVPRTRPTLTVRELRELLAVTLIVLGMVGFVVTAWIWQPLAGAAALCVSCVAVGAVLTLDW